MSGHHHHHDYHPPHQQQQEEGENAAAFTFPSNNGYDRSMGLAQQEQQIRRVENSTKLNSTYEPALYETAGMLSEMFNYGPTGGPAPEVLGHWYGQGQGVAGRQQLARDSNSNSDDQMQLFLTSPPPRSRSPPVAASGSTLQMLMPSPPNELQPPSGFHPMAALGGIHHQHNPSATTTANSNPPNFWGGELGGIVEGQGLSLSLSSSLQQLEAAKQQAEEFYHVRMGAASSSTTNNNNNPTSSPRHFFKHLAGPNHQHPILQNLQGAGPSFGPGMAPGPGAIQQQVHMGFGSPSSSTTTTLGGVNLLRSSKYAKAAQDLLEEFCSVGRGQLINKKCKSTRQNSNPNSNLNPSSSNEDGGVSTSSKDHQPPPPLSPADRIEHQRRKVKLLSMLDEVDRRYNHYCEQMQMVVNSFDTVMGYGASIPYTALAQKAMSRHFRCLKEGIQAQLKQSCEALGEKDPTTGSTGLTKGETPRLKMLEQSLRHQRAFHQMGLMEQHDAWRPQRGLPERSVNLLRAWLFEHFLHPYPSDADKHLLARQTGLSRNQVANWFINARVRLWKPMIEEMYQQESNQAEEEDDDQDEQQDQEQHNSDKNQTTGLSTNNSNTQNKNNNHHPLIVPTTKTKTQQQDEQQEAQNPIPSSSVSASDAHINNNSNNNGSTVSTSGSTVITDAKRSAETMTRGPPPHHDIHTHQQHHRSLLLPINTHHHQLRPNTASAFPPPGVVSSANHQAFFGDDSDCQEFGDNVSPTTIIRFGTTPGDVSLTLGLRHNRK